MLERDSILYVIKALTRKEKRKEAFAIIDLFLEQAKEISDYDALGECALEAKYFDAYLKCAELTYSMARTSAQKFNARENLYKAYNTCNYPEKALFYIEHNLLEKPDDFDSLTAYAFNLSLMNKKEEAEDILKNLANKFPKNKKDIQFGLAGALIRTGNLAEGMNLFINHSKPKSILFEDALKLERWDGKAYPGRDVIINGEGGIGDEIINIRFFKHIKELGMNPLLHATWHEYRPDLTDIFRRHGFEVSTNSMFYKKDALWTYMMNIPVDLKLKEEDLWYGPYLKPLRKESNRLPQTNGLRIGIKCNGNPYFEQDIYRSIPIDELLGALPKDADIYYFDKEKEHPDVISLKDRLNTWDDTLDYIDQMDIIVSSCTSLVHAAGAMGKRTVVVVPIAEYYTWTSTRKDSSTPWYGDNFTVFKQTQVRSWKEPLEQVKSLFN